MKPFKLTRLAYIDEAEEGFKYRYVFDIKSNPSDIVAVVSRLYGTKVNVQLSDTYNVDLLILDRNNAEGYSMVGEPIPVSEYMKDKPITSFPVLAFPEKHRCQTIELFPQIPEVVTIVDLAALKIYRGKPDAANI